MKNILITGAAGQVGREFQALESDFPQFSFLFTGKFELDITNPRYIADFFSKNEIDYCINCAGYTNVDIAESEPELAHLINVTGVKELAQSCLTRNIPLVHLSTDYVYHGNFDRPILETDPTDPKSIYATTKLLGEQVAQQIHPMTMIIRTSWVFSPFGKNFVKTMLRLAQSHSEISVVSDQIGTPTYAYDLAKAILMIIEGVEKNEINSSLLRGIYHYSNEGKTTWSDFALEIFKKKDLPTGVNPINTVDYPTAAVRPPYSLLDKTKFKETFKLDIADWKTSLAHCLERFD